MKLCYNIKNKTMLFSSITEYNNVILLSIDLIDIFTDVIEEILKCCTACRVKRSYYGHQSAQILHFCGTDSQFSEAARRSGLTQPSISHHINELEKQLGCKLFIRDKRSVTLTDAGKVFLPSALEMVEISQKAALQVASMEQGRGGHISIAALTTSSVILSKCLTAFSAAYPDITVDINFTSGKTQALIMDEEKYDLHFAVEEMVPVGETFEYIRAHTDRLCLALPKGHPLSGRVADFSKLGKERFIACSQNDGPALYNQIMQVCRTRGYEPNITCSYDRAEAVLLSVGAGLGISIIPEALSHVFYSDNVDFVPIEGEDVCRNYVIAWRRNVKKHSVTLFTNIARGLFEPGN